jgi:glycosyltransferase involved in cell wall biosynthesis
MTDGFRAVVVAIGDRSMEGRGPALKPGVPAVLQVLPSLVTGGVERGACDMARAIESAGLNAVVMSAGGPMADGLVGEGLRHVQAPVAAKSPLTIWRNAARIARVAEAVGAPIIHARSRAPAWSALLAARRTNVAFVTTFHGTYNFKGPLKRWYNSVMTRGDRVIAISQFIADHIAANYACPAGKVRVIHRGIDTAALDPAAVDPSRVVALRTQWGLDDPDRVQTRPVVMLPARLARWKGHAVLIRALAELRADAVVQMVGGAGHADYRAQMIRLAMDLGVGSRVRFVGDWRDMPAAYALADIVVSASTDPEGFGRVTVEAQAMGRPVIAPAHGAAPETLIDLASAPDTGTGWLVPPGDASALAAALDRALALTPAERAAIGARGRANAIAHFSREAMCAATLKVYAELVPAIEARLS